MVDHHQPRGAGYKLPKRIQAYVSFSVTWSNLDSYSSCFLDIAQWPHHCVMLHACCYDFITLAQIAIKNKVNGLSGIFCKYDLPGICYVKQVCQMRACIKHDARGLGDPMTMIYRTGNNAQTTGIVRQSEGPTLLFN